MGSSEAGSSCSVPDSRMVWGAEPELFGPLHFFRVGLVIRTLRSVLPVGRVLDAGCGAGSLSLALGRLGYSVNSVDNSDGFCRHVSATASSLGLDERISVIRVDIERLPFRDSSFSGLVCGDVLEHIEGDWAALSEFQRVLRPGGVFVITVPVGEELWDKSDEWAGHFRRYNRRKVFELLDRAGLSVEKVESYGFPFGRIYHRLITMSIVSRSSAGPESGSRFTTFKRYGRNPAVVRLLAALLNVDRFIHVRSLSSGILISGRKAGQ